MNREIKARVLDVSKYQELINWAKVKASGMFDGVVIRVGYRGYGNGKLTLDPYFKKNIEGAHSVGLPMGFYFFSTAVSVAEAVEEAQYVMGLLKGYPVAFIAYDLEGYEKKAYRTYSLTKAQRTAHCKAFLETCEVAGYTGVIYGSQGLIRSKFDLSALPGYLIWCARYKGGDTSIIDNEEYFPNIGEFTDRIVMWQYTKIGTVPGIAGKVDLNYCYTDLFTKGGAELPKPEGGFEMKQYKVPTARNMYKCSNLKNKTGAVSKNTVIRVYNIEGKVGFAEYDLTYGADYKAGSRKALGYIDLTGCVEV